MVRLQINNRYKEVYGQLLIEVLIAIALFAILLPALLTGFVSSREGKAQQNQRIEAVALEKESEEVVRSVREKGWSSFAQNGTFHPVVSNNSWTLASGTEAINGYTRSITLSDVYRDANGVVVSNGGTLDPSTKKVTISVQWSTPTSSSVTSTMYVTRYVQNTASTQTSQAEFQNGIVNNTQVTNTSGGEITLAPNTKAKWCSPSFSSSTIDLPDGPPVAVAATASSSVSSPNKAFVATAPTTSTPIKMAYVTVAADTQNPVPSLQGTFTLDPTKYSAPGLVPSGIGLTNTFKTNDITYYKSAAGKLYALLATDLSDHEIVAVQINDGNGDSYQDSVNKIYKYWTFFNTRIYGITGSQDTGFLSPSANSSDSGGDGNGYETNATRAYANDSSFATDTNSGNGTGTNCTGADKDKHRFYNYGISVPSGATIEGVEVRLDAKVDSTSNAPKICVQLSWDGGNTWTSTQSTGTLTTNEATYTLGGSTDTWGRVWNDTNFSNSNFRVRVIDVASSTSRDFSLDWAAVKVYYTGGVLSSNDQAPFNYGAKSVRVLGDTGYVTSGGYLYAFDLSNIDSKSSSNGLDQIGCRIELDGYDCSPGTGTDKKYTAGETDTTWSSTTSPAHNDCSDGGNIELYADNDIYPIQVGANKYVYIAVGAGTNPEFEIVNVTSVPNTSSSPSISNNSCGRISGGNSGWKMTGSLDFNNSSNTEEAANSVWGRSDGLRAYISSNGGIDANHDGQPDSKQFYVIDTTNKSAPAFLSGSGSGPTSGYYYGSSPNDELYPRRSLTVLNGKRAVLVGKDGVSDAKDATEYQVLNIENESSPAFCGSVNFDQGFNDLTSVSEADGDNFVYMVANTTLNELKIIQGGPDGTYLDSGTYESSPVDAGQTVAFNRLSTSTTLPANTTVQFQVAVANAVNGSCTNASYQYVGPDGTAGTYFPSKGGTVPLVTTGSYSNPGRCIKYKAFLSTTDYNVTPQFLDASVNYSL